MTAITLKCKMCGGSLELIPDSTVCECLYCGTRQTVPALDDEKKAKLYDRANKLRMNSEFDKASVVYESIIEDYEDEAEAYWGNLLCKYGIEYVDDPADGHKVPTCHRSSYDSFMEDPDFEMVMENSDAISRSVYREQAKEIEEIRKGIVEVSSQEEPYDIFICYKETADDGQRTTDSVLAQNVYEALVEKGYRVFFSRITLEEKLGTEYEPYIFAALHSAKVMLAFGTSYDYYNAVWVKNEWSRYLKLMAKDKDKYLIPCYKDIDAYDIPKEFSHLQAQDMGKVGALQDLLRGIDKLIGEKKAGEHKETISAEIQDVVSKVEKAEAEAAKQKRINHIIIIAVVCILLIAAGAGVFYFTGLLPESNYQAAVEKMENGHYDTARAEFEGMRGYKDSIEKIQECLIREELKVLSEASVGGEVKFGSYEQNDNESDGAEDMEWIVLEKQSDRILLISKYIIDAQPYDADGQTSIWENCSLRKWLNESFFNTAFTAFEAEQVLNTKVPVVRSVTTVHENNTYDYVFLLSADKSRAYLEDNIRASLTVYAQNNTTANWWWVRSSGGSRSATGLLNNGSSIRHSVDENGGVRPVIWVSLERNNDTE